MSRRYASGDFFPRRPDCVAIGVPKDSVCLLQTCPEFHAGYIRRVDGAEVPPMNADVVRFDSILARYGARYNAEILRHRLRRVDSRSGA